MSVETIGSLAPFESETHPPEARAKKRWPSRPAWLLRITIESFFIVLSILAALAVENLREDRSNERLALQSLRIFEREIRQNLALIDNNAPFHAGMFDLLTQARADSEHAVDMKTVMEFVEGLQQEQREQTLLRNTAWQTALATGALTKIDMETVSALSLTYSMQQRFVEETRASLPRLVATVTITSMQERSAIDETYAYVSDLVSAEQQLRGFYQQALEIITNTLRAHGVADSAQQIKP